MATIEKTCTVCRRSLPATPEHFYRQKLGKYGVQAVCKGCAEAKYHRNRAPKAHFVPEGAAKCCGKCGESKPATAEHWSRHPFGKYGFDSFCKPCRRAATDYERMRRTSRDWYLSNRHAVLAKQAAERDADRDGYRERKRAAWREWVKSAENRIRHNAKRRNRAALQRAADGRHTSSDVQRQLDGQKHRCWWCRKKLRGGYHVDHRIALSRGGSNGPENIVIACAFCNVSKGARRPEEWAGLLL